MGLALILGDLWEWFKKNLAWVLLIIVLLVGYFMWPEKKPEPPNNVLIEVLNRQIKVDSMVRKSYELLKDRDNIISSRDTFVLKATERIIEKYIQDDKKIDNAPISVQPAITERLHSRYDNRRLKESK